MKSIFVNISQCGSSIFLFFLEISRRSQMLITTILKYTCYFYKRFI